MIVACEVGPMLKMSEPITSIIILNKKLSWCWQTRETRLEVSQGHQTWYHSTCYVWFPISML